MQNIVEQFSTSSDYCECGRYGNGHINETYLVECKNGSRYIIQKINKYIFKNPAELMENISAVCSHLSEKTEDSRRYMKIIKTKDGKDFYVDAKGEYWRCYDFVEDTICLDKIENKEDFYESAYGFGMFQNLLSDFDASRLHETIKDFHNTPVRYQNFHKALEADVKGRAKDVQPEINFALEMEKYASVCLDALKNNEIPLRVTHNDTKLNNVLLDRKTRKALCVIDLDTVMPGLSVNDFGDSIRFGASSAAEDEQNLQKVYFVPEYYEAYSKGFLEACGKSLTDREIELLPWGAILMTLECGVRFLTDYLEGDVYFRTNSPEQNKYRTRTQFKLVSEMLEKLDWMTETVKKYK